VLGAGVPTFAMDDHRGGVQEPGDAHFSCHPKRHRRSVIVLQRVPVDVTDVDPKADLGGQVDDGVAAGCRRREPIMINEIVLSIEYPVEDTDRMPAVAS
jgi:hypothetical protein